jgi:hypothetical protein
MDDSRVAIITSEMEEAAAKFLMEFFPAEWGGAKGISKHEAMAAARGALEAAAVARPPPLFGAAARSP